jgi:Fur family ferric uptake transcriptional regulator
MIYATGVLTAARDPWQSAAEQMRARGMRWTPQRRLVIDVLARSSGHVAASDVIEQCRQADPLTTPSTVYRTLDALETLGLIQHGHAADGREEYHVLPQSEHGHRYCTHCGRSWEIGASEAHQLVQAMRDQQGFEVDLSHLTIVGRCADCVR